MAYDEGIATILRDALEDEPGMAEKRMFGGLAFLRYGHMVAGVHCESAMVRVGPPNVERALEVPGASRLEMGGRIMGGMVGVDADAIADDERRGSLLAIALDHVRDLPPK